VTDRRPRTAVLTLLGLVVMLGLSACGSRQDRITRSETEGNYLDVGSLQYQVQVSRQLNPFDTEDRSYLVGVPNAARVLAPNETWFGVFMRVENSTKHPEPVAGDYEIVDTQGHIFRPITIGPDNVFAYRPNQLLAGRSVLPDPASLAGNSPIRGSLVLFRLTLDALANRPLELRIKNPTLPTEEAVVNLDV
jgi:hypothetical protein